MQNLSENFKLPEFCSSIFGRTPRAIRNMEVTLMSIHLFQSSSLNWDYKEPKIDCFMQKIMLALAWQSTNLESRTEPWGTHPATLNKTSILVNFWQYFSTAAESVTSKTSEWIPLGKVFSVSAFISLAYTSAPSLWNSSAVARPIPFWVILDHFSTN